MAGMAHEVTGEVPDVGIVRFAEGIKQKAGVEESSLEQQKLNVYMTLMKGALRRRGKPVVVGQRFTAVI
jgi:hypothetical protein